MEEKEYQINFLYEDFVLYFDYGSLFEATALRKYFIFLILFFLTVKIILYSYVNCKLVREFNLQVNVQDMLLLL